MLGLMGFSGSLPLYVIHRYYIFVFIDRANKDACLLVHWPLMDGLLHLVQRGGDWPGPQLAQAHPRCIKCSSVPITVLLYNGLLQSNRPLVH